MNEVLHEEQDNLSDSQILAIKIADEIAATIQDQYSQVLAAIISRRLAFESFQSIAQAEAASLRELGATTDAVRLSIVQRICNGVLSEQTEARIKSHVRSRASKKIKPAFTNEERRRSIEACQIHDWTDTVNDTLQEAARTILHEGGSHAGKPDWERISSFMKEQHGIDLTKLQWIHRFQHLGRMRNRRTTSTQ